MTRETDIAIVGGGIAGLATAAALADGGLRVLVLEQFALGHTRGSSHGASRIFRLSYPDPEYVRMARDSLDRWRRLEARVGEELLVTTGSLDCGAYAAAHAEAMRKCGVETEKLDADEAERRFGVSLPGDALLQRDGGMLRADRCLEAFRRVAVDGGVDVVGETRVTAVGEEGVEIDGGTIAARVVVVTAGSWAPALLAAAGIELAAQVTRETVVHLRLQRDEPPPSLIQEVSPGRMPYALASPGVGLKAGVHQAGPTVDPDEAGGPEPALVEETVAWASARFPDADPNPVKVETCLYTTTPDDAFVIERHGAIVVGSPCSGHGFKFAPVTGERLAALALAALD